MYSVFAMLTQDDLKAIGQLIDNKLKNIELDVAAIQTRTAEIESHQLDVLHLFEMRGLLKSIEKRVTVIEGKLTKIASKDDLRNFATKDDLRKALRGIVTRKDILLMERRFVRKINLVLDNLDSKQMTFEKRLVTIENNLNLPSNP